MILGVSLSLEPARYNRLLWRRGIWQPFQACLRRVRAPEPGVNLLPHPTTQDG